MTYRLFLKRIFMNKIYWLSVVAALFLLLCSIVYQDAWNGKQYTFLSLLYHAYSKETLIIERISIKDVLLGHDLSYLWMFCPILVGIPCILTQKVERFVVFRTDKKNYIWSKYVSNLLSGGSILVLAYLLFAFIGTWISQENLWDIYLLRKLLSVFCWGMVSAIPGIILSEYIRNKYLILCIPFVLNYFLRVFLIDMIPQNVWKYVAPDNYETLFLENGNKIVFILGLLVVLITACGLFLDRRMERRCDCGQK